METNINDIETFIFIHDQDILLDFIGKNKFTDIHNFKWVFLGKNPVDKLSSIKNIIVARDLEDNIEQYPKLTSFTGWYALYKNGLLKSKYVNLFEYDIKYIPEFVDINKEMIKNDFDFIGYFPMSIFDVVYIKDSRYSNELIGSVKHKENKDIVDMINNLPPNTTWSSSSNSTWKVDVLKKYLDWFTLYINDIKDSIYCGHIHERSISFYYFLENLNVRLTQGLMFHAQLNSHGTSPLPPERAKQMYNLL
jgi:hypothetical protein